VVKNPGLFVPLHFRSWERKVHRENFRSRGTSVPWNIRSLELSLLCNLRPIIKIIIGLSVQPVLLKAAPAAPAPEQAKQRCVMGLGMCLYAKLVQPKNKQCKSATFALFIFRLHKLGIEAHLKCNYNTIVSSAFI